MTVPQMAVIAALALWGRPWHALAVTALLAAQLAAMRVLLADPRGRAPWYNGTGVLLYVTGMMVAATAIRGLGG
jgi:chlorophyll synthase